MVRFEGLIPIIKKLDMSLWEGKYYVCTRILQSEEWLSFILKA